MNVFKSRNDFIEHSHTSHDVTNTHTHLSDLEKIQNILTSRIFNEDLGNVREKDINANAFDEKDLKKIPSNSSKTHSNSNTDTIYIMRPKRISKPSQKVQLNEK